MRSLIALLVLTAPAMAHPEHGLHLHETDGFWFAAMAFVVGVSLSSIAVVRAVRAKA